MSVEIKTNYKDSSIEMTVHHDKGSEECEHDWSKSELLFLKKCKKCGRTEEYNKRLEEKKK